jgi:ATP-dependent Clp protease ATP-binding subunit ClpA
MKIIGTGRSHPSLVVTNEMLSQFLDTSDEWITSRTGIKERRIISSENLEDLAIDAAKKALADAFRPEFINRLDEIIVFKPLDRQTLTEIARQRLASFVEGARARGVSIEIDEEVAEALAALCLRAGSGARPLNRAIVKYIEDPVSLFFLSSARDVPLSVTVGVREGVPFAERKN